MIKIRFYGLLRMQLQQAAVEVEMEGATLAEALRAAEGKIEKPFLHLLAGKSGEPAAGVIILINGRNVHFAEKLATPVAAGDEIDLFPPVGGG